MPEATVNPPAKQGDKSIFVLLLVVAGLFGAYKWNEAEQEKERRAREAAAFASQYEERQRLIKIAMTAGVAMVGMTKYQILQSKGQPDSTMRTSAMRDDAQFEKYLKAGVFEVMYYPGSKVCVDVEGMVVHVE